MKRREKQRAKVELEDDDAQNNNTASNPVIIVSSDDEEANEDLSLKIVQKALLMRVAKLVPNDEVFDEPTTARGSGCDEGLVASSSCQAESVVVLDDDALGGTSGIDASGVSEVDNGEVKMSRRKKKKLKKVDTGEGSVIVAEEKEMVKTLESTDKIESEGASTVQMGRNIVLQKLLRGPRYFDPPDIGWGTCYNCGEEGHAAVNCTAAKRKKPCFVCGSLEHKSKQCNMAQDCFICKKGGHRAKDCPEKYKGGSKSSMICLKCGDPGHDMFSCKNNYSLDDLKEIQCYVCKRFGHLCCVRSDDDRPREVSCYKCGRLGHTGLACTRLRGEATGEATPSSCYKCGEEGHFARECTSSAKVVKRNRESSNQRTPFLKFHKEKDYKGYRSAPHDMGKARKKKVITEEIGFATPKKSKRRGGWITEDPEDFSPKRSRKSSWRSPATPSTKSPKFSYSGGRNTKDWGNSYISTSPRMWNGHAGSSKSPGPAKFSQHRFSASRFGNSNSGHGKNYDWW